MQRRVIRYAAVAAAVVLVGALAAVVIHDSGDNAGTHLRAAAPSTSTTEATTTTAATEQATSTTATTATTPAAKAPATTAKPRPKTTTAPKPKTTTSGGTVHAGQYGPRPPGSVSFPADPNRTSWTATQNGVTMTLTIDRQHAPVGQPVTFTLQASSAEACCGLHLLYGDGAGFDRQPTVQCGQGPGSGGTRTETAAHPFNSEGRWEFSFQAYTGNCNTDYHSYASFFGWVYITPGTPTGQGPTPPAIDGGWAYSPDGHDSRGLTAKVGGHARDEDGYLHHFTIAWGDGAVTTSPGDPNGCRPTPGGWPATSDAWYPPITNPPTPPPEHTYAAPGDYTVTVTAHSIGCNGTDEQTAKWTAVWHTDGYNP